MKSFKSARMYIIYLFHIYLFTYLFSNMTVTKTPIYFCLEQAIYVVTLWHKMQELSKLKYLLTT